MIATALGSEIYLHKGNINSIQQIYRNCFSVCDNVQLKLYEEAIPSCVCTMCVCVCVRVHVCIRLVHACATPSVYITSTAVYVCVVRAHWAALGRAKGRAKGSLGQS